MGAAARFVHLLSMRNLARLLPLFLLAGCPESRSITPDAGALADVGALADAGPPPGDAPDLGDVVVTGHADALAGRTLWLRLFDNSVFVGTAWRRVEVAADGTFEVRFVDGMPADVFGVFVDAFLDEGDEVCVGDPAFRGFASNDFSAEIAVVFFADPDTGVTCADLGW
jgi:hypothetical protein